MKMPFGDQYKDQELDTLPDSYLNWIDRTVEIEPPLTVRPENRDDYRATRAQLLAEVRRIMRERRRNGVRVPDPAMRRARCKSCKASIVWFRTAAGRSMPVDASSVLSTDTQFDARRHMSHFATCPNADQHRRRQ